MKDPEVKRIRAKILIWGRKHYQDYPWRDIESPWLALIAEVLLQRTSARHVCRYYDEVCQTLPDPQATLGLSEVQLTKLANKFGLTRRVKTFVDLAHYIDYLDYYPDQLEELTEIYGVGHYTASAYLSLHMNVRAILIDANVARWLSRMQGTPRPKDVRKAPDLWALADRLTPQRGFKEFNYAVLDFTMMVCRPRNPDCKNCPVSHYCAEYCDQSKLALKVN